MYGGDHAHPPDRPAREGTGWRLCVRLSKQHGLTGAGRDGWLRKGQIRVGKHAREREARAHQFVRRASELESRIRTTRRTLCDIVLGAQPGQAREAPAD